MVVTGVLAAILIPNFVYFNARAKTVEAKGNLQALATAEMSYQAEHSALTADMAAIGFRPERSNRYAYFLAASGPTERPPTTASVPPAHPVIIDVDTGKYPYLHAFATFAETGCPLATARADGGPPLALGVSGTGAQAAFLAAAAGNVDNDATINCWSVSSVKRRTPSGATIAAGRPYHEQDDVHHLRSRPRRPALGEPPPTVGVTDPGLVRTTFRQSVFHQKLLPSAGTRMPLGGPYLDQAAMSQIAGFDSAPAHRPPGPLPTADARPREEASPTRDRRWRDLGRWDDRRRHPRAGNSRPHPRPRLRRRRGLHPHHHRHRLRQRRHGHRGRCERLQHLRGRTPPPSPPASTPPSTPVDPPPGGGRRPHAPRSPAPGGPRGRQPGAGDHRNPGRLRRHRRGAVPLQVTGSGFDPGSSVTLDGAAVAPPS